MFSNVLVTAVILSTACACTTEEILEKPDTPERLVRVLFSPGGLGDLSYNDDILRGIVQEQQHTDFRLYYLSPADMEVAESLVRAWQQTDGNARDSYTILAGSEFEGVAQRTDPDTLRSDFLMFDTADSSLSVTTFRFRGYGVSFLAGIAAYILTGADSAAYLGGWQGDSFLRECYQGFADGYSHAGGKQVAECYISQSPAGFAMPAQAYRMADSLFHSYPFIYTMAGGSNNGVYQYLREHPEAECYTNGVDIDQSAYSDRIIGSMVKNVGDCVAAYIRAWANGEPMPHHAEYDLTSGFIHFNVSDRYRDRLQQSVRDSWDIAIRREQEFIEKEQ